MKLQGASTPFFDAACKVVGQAQLQGYGQEDIAATAKIFIPSGDFPGEE
jgi:hypothetical protein